VLKSWQVSAPDLGEVTQIKVEHDGNGFGADWYLETVTISKAGGRPRTFKAEQWLKGVRHGRDNGTGFGAEVTLGVPPEQRRARLEARARHQRMNRAEKLLSTLAVAYHNAGVELEWLGRMAQAYGSYEKALSLTTQLGPAHPTSMELTEAYAHLPFVHNDEASEADSDAEMLEMLKGSGRPGSAGINYSYQSKGPMNFDKLMSMDPTGSYTPSQLSLIRPHQSRSAHAALGGVAPAAPTWTDQHALISPRSMMQTFAGPLTEARMADAGPMGLSVALGAEAPPVEDKKSKHQVVLSCWIPTAQWENL